MKRNKLKSYFNIWIEIINLLLQMIVLGFSLYQLSILNSESMLVKSNTKDILNSVIFIHVIWFFIYIQIPFFYYLVTGRNKINIRTFKFNMIKIHWLRTCLSVVFAFIAFYNLQTTTGLILNLTTANFILVLVILVIITYAGILYFNKTFYNKKLENMFERHGKEIPKDEFLKKVIIAKLKGPKTDPQNLLFR